MGMRVVAKRDTYMILAYDPYLWKMQVKPCLPHRAYQSFYQQAKAIIKDMKKKLTKEEQVELATLKAKYCCYIDCPRCSKPSAFDKGEIEKRLKELGHSPFME